jgi:hypothetical protein
MMADTPTVQDLEAQGKYSEAATLLRTQVSQSEDGPEPETDSTYYYNMGTLYLKNRDLGRATAYLEKASTLSPEDAQVKAQNESAMLQWVKQMGSERVDPGQSIPNLVSEFAGFTFVLGALALLLFMGSLRSLRFLRSASFRSFVGSSLGLQTLGLTALLGLALGMAQISQSEGVFVLKEPTEIRSGPESTFMTLDRLPPGIRLRVLLEVKPETRLQSLSWYKIRYGSGQIGWVPSTSGLLLTPASTTQKSR